MSIISKSKHITTQIRDIVTKVKTKYPDKLWVLIPMLFSLIAGIGFGGLLLSDRAGPADPSPGQIIDDFDNDEGRKSNLIWTLIPGQTEGNNIAGQKEFVQNDGRSCLHIKAPVSSKNNWIIVGTKTTPDNPGDLNTAFNDGIYLRAKGTDGIWTLGLWIRSAQGLAQFYQAPFELKNRWREIRLPFRMLRSLPVNNTINDRELFRIGTMAPGQRRPTEIFLDEIGFYREQKMYNKLTPEEERVIVHKGTERPFSGEYDNHYEKGIYTCKCCGAHLFESSSKFKSGCGWPSFDEQIQGAVKWQPDADGIRTEIICNHCQAHLGHVFLGEGLTPKNTRYCVNSVSMDFEPAQKQQIARAIFASGCFWGTEYYFQRAPGVISTTVGYTGGHVENPTYKQVCTDTTGHAEAVEVLYDPSITSYEQLAKLFFETHDFTQLNRQGPDIGKQYRSAVFYLDKEQKETATQLIRMLNQKGYDVKTQIVPADKFWPAEQYHQDYYEKTAKVPYCHTSRQIF